MSVKVLETKILNRSKDKATVEMVISDSADIDKSNEFLMLRLEIPYAEAHSVANIEKLVLEKTSKICDQIVAEMRERLYP